MTRRIAVLVLPWLMLLSVGICQPALAQMQAPMSSTNVTGDWAVQMTGNQFVSGNIHLSQVGNTVVGSAVAPPAFGNGNLQFSGKFEGQKFSGTWKSPKGETGWVTLNFTSGMDAFNGDWGYNGRKPNGHIVARKVKSTKF